MKTKTLWLLSFCALGLFVVQANSTAAAEARTTDELGWQFEYDDSDRITKVTDPAGRATRMEYFFNTAKRLRKLVRTAADGSKVIHELDERGRRSSMTDSAGTVSYGYDDLDRLNRVQRQGAPVIAYTYDTLDRIKSLQVGDFYRIEYAYDFLGRLESMTTPAGVIHYEYLTGQGMRVRTLPNGVKTLWEYEPNGELSRITHGLARDPNDTRYEVLAEYSYQYRSDGLIKAIQERSGAGQFVRTYDYDTVGRLVSAAGPSGEQHTYEYDLVGNRVKALSAGKALQTVTYDWAGRMTTLDGNPIEYDTAGNLTSLTVGRTTLKYRYNQDDQLAEVGGGKVSYRYDGDGQLITRTAGGTETTFIPDPLSDNWQPLVMEDKEGHQTLMVWEGATPLMMIRDGKPEYFLHDHLGSVRMVADARGKVIQRINYEPFGAILEPTTTAKLAPRFGGLLWDPEAQSYLTLARLYSPTFGHWLQLDPMHRVPLASSKHFSIYVYCGDDPVNYVDRDGLEPERFGSAPFTTSINEAIRYSRRLGLVGSSPNFLQSDLSEQSNDLLIDTIRDEAFDQLEELWGIRVAGFSSVPRFYGLLSGTLQSAQSIRDHPGEPASDWRALSIGLKAYSFLGDVYGWGELLPGAAGGLATIGAIAHTFGEATRSRILQNRAERLVSFGPATPNQPSRIKEDYDRYHGHFSALSDRYSVYGGWALRDSYSGWLSKSSHSQLWAVSHVKDLATMSGARISGDFRRSEIRDEYGKNLFNLYEPTSVVVRRHRYESYRITRGGSVQDRPSDVRGAPNTVALSGRPPLRGSDDPQLELPGGGGGGRGWGGPPSPVGGVYLAGAGQSLADLGLLDGVTLDNNKNLVLIGKSGQEINLPPLRLDDVVTIFRSVYLYGEGPTVTIDPNPENPEGSAMIIRHGKATENTYVGWVLYEADRLMKGYTLGIDNITEQEIATSVPDYAKVLNTIYFGGVSPQKLLKEGHWERFWIVPAEARRFGADKQALTLFDVPLKVKTQSMKWENGKLVDDPRGNSSPGALAFTKWFTNQYDLIAGERFLTPPRESGITGPVPVFTELRRIALITAIAEKLRDQGVPMPFWMRDYAVQPVPFEKLTPGLEVTRSNQRTVARIYGGVELSPADKDVRNFTSSSDLSTLPKTERTAVRAKIDLADSLEKAVRTEMAVAEPLKVRTFKHQGAAYQAVALPGTETRSLAPCRLEEVDLSVPIEGGYSIQLARSYNSFFNPSGPWGQGWVLDLPRLDEIKVPIRREGSAVHYQTAYELITPLNSIYARFSRIEEVPALNNSRLLVSDQPSDFFGLADAQPEFISGPTRKLIRKDGGAWHFSQGGGLVVVELSGFRIVYERKDARLTRIVGLLGRQPMAVIELSYDASGRLASAKGRGAGREAAESIVRYEYDDAGRLMGVMSEAGRLGYRYQGSWVTAITYQAGDKDGKAASEVILRSFEYNPRGQLLSEVAADGTRTAYRVTSDANGSAITMQRGSASEANAIRYDPSFRPMEASYADGTRASWSYPAGGGTVLDVAGSEGETIRLTESADQRGRTLEFDKQREITGEYDTAGRLTSLAENGLMLLRQEWTPDGRLRMASSESTATYPEYGPDGLVSRVILAPPGESDQLSHWQETKLDPAGRPVEISDYRGLKVFMSYEDSGELAGMVTQRDGKNYDFTVARDQSGRIQEVRSSWGKQLYTYDNNGLPAKLEVDKGKNQASAEWQSGLLKKVKQFDGGDISLTYYEDEERSGLPERITMPNGLALSYQYDMTSRLHEVAVGDAFRLALDYDAKGRLSGWHYRPAGR